MAGKSNISWTDWSWNPTTGCTRVSRGCDNCYAFALHDFRHLKNKAAAIAAGAKPSGEGGYTPAQVARGFGAPLPFPPQYDKPFSRVQLLPDRLREPLRWRKPRRVFVDSMSDLFHEKIPDGYLDDVFAVMALASRQTFQILTKRPERMRAYLGQVSDERDMQRWENAAAEIGLDATPFSGAIDWPLPNVWLGVSVEDQESADERVPLLLDTPAAVRFVSAEPLIGPVDFMRCGSIDALLGHDFEDIGDIRDYGDISKGHHPPPLDWIIVGGESGKRRTEMDLDWARSIRDQCRAANVPFFFKQASAPLPGRKSGDPELDNMKEFPDVRVA